MTTATTEGSKAQAVGVNFWYTVPGLLADVDKVQQLLVKHGFDKEDIPVPSERAEVSRAVHGMQDRRHKENRRIAEVARNAKGEVVYGILDREQKAADEVAFEQGTTVTYDREANRVHVKGVLAVEVQDRIDQYKGKYTDADMRGFLRRLVRMCRGVAKRPTGGIYFVPFENAAVIDQAREFLAEVNSGAALFTERVMDGAEERKNVWVAVEDDLDDRLDTIIHDVERIEKRASALANHAEQVEEVKEMVKVYERLLGEEAKYQDIVAKIEVAANAITAKMAEFADKGEARAAARAGEPPKGEKKRVKMPKAEREAVKQAAMKALEGAAAMHITEIEAELSKIGVNPKGAYHQVCLLVEEGKVARVGKGKFAPVVN